MTGADVSDETRPRAAVVSESMFGNTAALAREVGFELRSGGFDVEVWSVGDAPSPSDLDVDLLVVGAPTHALSLSRPATREDAVRQGADVTRAHTGVREWLASGTPSNSGRPHVALFDTRAAKARHLPGSAARSASRLIRKGHLGTVVGTESFYVDDVDGPLLEGELSRARGFARHLVASMGPDHRSRSGG